MSRDKHDTSVPYPHCRVSSKTDSYYSTAFRLLKFFCQDYKETRDSRNTPSTTNTEEEEIVKAPGNVGNASIPEQVKRPNPWWKMMMMMMTMTITRMSLIGVSRACILLVSYT